MKLVAKIVVSLLATSVAVLGLSAQLHAETVGHHRIKLPSGQTVTVAVNSGITMTKNQPRHKLSLFNPHDMNPKYLRQVVGYETRHKAGTIIVDTGSRLLYLVMADGLAMRYGIGVARNGFEWSGTHKITNKREWPGWTPPAEMRQRQPNLPEFMPGGPNNPLGARALYIGSTLYRIHGTTEPWSIGGRVSSGCIRLTNIDVKDLFGRVRVGATVVVL